MEKQAVIRRVRIAVAVFFGVLTVALCVLWVRSHWIVDSVYAFCVPQFSISSARGMFHVFVEEPTSFNGTGPKWAYVNHQLGVGEWPSPRNYLGFRLQFSRSGYSVAPHWFGVSVAAALSIAAWRNFWPRFSVRTLLIATTLVAVVLGLVVWLGR